MTPTLTFHGAAGCVTGSCAELRTDKARILVDCGMFQGSKTLKALNYDPFPFDPRDIAAVLLTHAHIDHSGLLPKLMLAGFKGPIYATAATRDLCEVMLADAGGIQESEVRALNRRNQRRGGKVLEPIYTAQDAEQVMGQFQRVKLGEATDVLAGVQATYWDAGHILGSASIELNLENTEGPLRLLFSGDLGPGGSEFVADPQGPVGVDHIILESTYGDRDRPPLDPAERRRALADELTQAHAAGGPLLIPAFAVERTQELLADLLAVMASGEAPEGDIFLDSPLGIKATEVFLQRGWNAQIERNPFEQLHPKDRLRFLPKPWDSDTLERLKGWHIILASSGMCEAGRIRKHLKRVLWRKETTVLLAGFQAAGTLGRLLSEGAKRVLIQGDEIKVAARIRQLDTYSGHAGAHGLVDWALARQPVKGTVFLNHGEPGAITALRGRLIAAGFAEDRVVAVEMDRPMTLTGDQVQTQEAAASRIARGAASTLDWHNSRARFLLDLNDALGSAGTDAEREQLLTRLERLLDQKPEAGGSSTAEAVKETTP